MEDSHVVPGLSMGPGLSWSHGTGNIHASGDPGTSASPICMYFSHLSGSKMLVVVFAVLPEGQVRVSCLCVVSHRGVLVCRTRFYGVSRWHGDGSHTCLHVAFSSLWPRADLRETVLFSFRMSPHYLEVLGSTMSESSPSVCRKGLLPLQPPSCQPS